MARILGWLGYADEQEKSIAATLHAIRAARQTTAQDPLTIAGPGFSALVTSNEDGECGSVAGGISAAFVGRPLLNSHNATTPKTVLSEIIARYSLVGADVLNELRGAYALAIFDAKRRRGLVATDRMGIYSVFSLETASGLAFGSTPDEVLNLARVPARMSTQAVFDYIYCHVIPAPRAVFDGLRRLLPGECVQLERGRPLVSRYWQATFRESTRSDFGQLKREFLRVLSASVSDAMQGNRCGAFLSGGTDSSTIAGLMTRLGGEPAKTFSIGFAAAGYDEMEYARLASRHFGTQHHEYYATPGDVVDALPKLAAIHAQPLGNSSALPTFICARLAKESGVERLLGGDGGDELFGGNTRYAKQYIFSLYESIPMAVRKAALEPASRALNKYLSLLRMAKFVSYVEQASVPMPQRLETYNLLQRLGFDEVLTPESISQINTAEPTELNKDAYSNPTAFSLINKMLALDFKTTLADNDLPKVIQSCELAGVNVAFPMLDQRVIDFSLSLAPNLKLKGTQLRYFFKEALRDFLPAQILQKKKHGFGLPFGEWAVSHTGLRELTFDTLNSLKVRGWVRPAFIDRLKDVLLPSYPNYYGTLAFVLMMLELWSQQHYDRNQARIAED